MINVPDGYEVQVVRKEAKFKKGDIISSKIGLIAVFEKIVLKDGERLVCFSTIYSPFREAFVWIDKVSHGIGYETECSIASKEQRKILINALKKEAETNPKARKVLKDVFNIEVEPVIRTYEDLIDSSKSIAGYYIDTACDIRKWQPTVCDNWTRDVAVSEKVCKSMLAMAQISQLMPYYGGAISDGEWRNGDVVKYSIQRVKNKIGIDYCYTRYCFLAFHTPEQRDDFIKYNERLVKDYLMID